MRILCTIVTIFLFITSSVGQPIEWAGTSNWKLYDVTTKVNQLFDRDSIAFYRSEPLAVDSIKFYLSQVTLIDSSRSAGAIWMGDYWVSCEYRGKFKIVRLSRYGGFFMDWDTGNYFEIPIDKRGMWHQYLIHQFLKFVKTPD
jgi:hypothetical protein